MWRKKMSSSQGAIARAMKLVAWVGVLLSVAWTVWKPAFDSGSALLASMVVLGGLYIHGRKNVEKAATSQTQAVSGASTGVQAGRDININSK
jgi:hypothetical protein